jgi:hypothetical protein
VEVAEPVDHVVLMESWLLNWVDEVDLNLVDVDEVINASADVAIEGEDDDAGNQSISCGSANGGWALGRDKATSG